MTDILLDADALINFRTLSIGSSSVLAVLMQRAKEHGRRVYLTQYVAEHDLSDLQEEIAFLTGRGLLQIETLLFSDSDYRRLRDQVDKGEAEAIAWSLKRDRKDRPLFVARDTEALRCARREKVPATDLMGLLVEFVESGFLRKDEARAATEPWNDPGQQLGKPKDYRGFDVTFAKRLSRGPFYYP